MSIKYNGKTIAGGYVPKVSSELEHGIIRIATNEEVRQGRSNDVAITPKQLNDFGGRANLFDTKILDYVLPYEKSEGWALQGTYVYKTAILNERYGYPTFIEECINQKNQSIPTEVTLGNSIITMYIHSNGHKFYDISDKSVVDTWFNTYGIADFYGIDVENECVFLPRNDYFIQLTNDPSKINDMNEPKLPGITTNTTTKTTTSVKVTVPNTGWTVTGSALGTATKGTLLAGTGAGEKGETLESINATSATRAATVTQGATSTSTSTSSYNDNTVQPPSSNKLLYYCVGNTISDTSWIDTVTQTANGVQEIEDKRASSLEDIETARVNAVTNIEVDRANAITNIETDRLNAVNEIEVDRSSAVLEINTDRVNAVDEIKQHRKQALTDLINTENEGISALANASNALRQTQITNCITEIPQRIKYDLTDGTLTIKAGSVIIVPYGTEDLTSQYPVGATFINENFKVCDTQFTDGKFFVWAELVGDIVRASSGSTAERTRCLILNINASATNNTMENTSGAGDSTSTSTDYIHYDTTANLIKAKSSGTMSTSTLSLPLFKTQADLTYNVASISQVFNGIGYIGSTYWVDKGVKGLIPNGRNEDGTLNNIRFAPDKLLTYTFSSTLTFTNTNFAWGEDIGRLDYMGFSSTAWSYDEQDNYNKFRGLPLNWLPLGKCDLTAGVISNYHPKQPFRAVDQNSIWYDSSTSTLYIGV